ncbi:MAG: hypothetical protein AAGF11_07565 [Myxococcota bacterium]
MLAASTEFAASAARGRAFGHGVAGRVPTPTSPTSEDINIELGFAALCLSSSVDDSGQRLASRARCRYYASVVERAIQTRDPLPAVDSQGRST